MDSDDCEGAGTRISRGRAVGDRSRAGFFAHGRVIGLIILPPCAMVSSIGLWKLAFGAVQKPWGLFNVLSFGALLVLLVIAGYTGLFLALVTLRI